MKRYLFEYGFTNDEGSGTASFSILAECEEDAQLAWEAHLALIPSEWNVGGGLVEIQDPDVHDEEVDDGKKDSEG